MNFWVGTYTEDIVFGTGKVLHGKGEGIYSFSYDFDSGHMVDFVVNPGITNPSYLASSPDGRFLFAVNEIKEFNGMESGSVTSFAVIPGTRTLRRLSVQPTHGTDPCHIITDSGGKFVFLANFKSGSIAMYPVDEEGMLAPACSIIQHAGHSIHPTRQQGPHAHAVVLSPDEKFLFVPDLGLDATIVYEVDFTGQSLRERKDLEVSSTLGAGPRLITFHDSGRFAYIINELDSTIDAYVYHEKEGRLELTETLSTLPEGFTGESTCADLHISSCGRYLFGSNRGHDSLARYRIDQDTGALEFLGCTPTQGGCPRNFHVAGNHILVANQDSDMIAIFTLDGETGSLSFNGEEIAVPTPVCIIS